MTSTTRRISNRKDARPWTHQSLWVLQSKICLNNISAHQSNKNSTDDNLETMEIIPNPITEYDAHKAEGYVKGKGDVESNQIRITSVTAAS